MTRRTTNVSEKNYAPAIPGNYPFTVVKVHKDYFSGNSTTEACDQYDVDIKVDCGDQGQRDVVVHLRDCAQQDWKFAQLFVSCGLITPDKNGDVTYDTEWCEQTEGKSGVLRLWNRSYERNGKTEWTNEVKFLSPGSVDGLAMGPQPGASLPPVVADAPQASAPAPAAQADDIPF